MTRPDRYDGSDRKPLLCPITAPNGRTFTIGEFDVSGLYLWCRWCHKSHYFPFSQVQAAVNRIATSTDASTCVPDML